MVNDYDAEGERQKNNSALLGSGFRVEGPNESSFRRLIRDSDFVSRSDLKKVDGISRKYGIGSSNRESFFNDLYENTLGGKRIGNALGFLTGGIGTYLLSSGDGTLETARNVAVSSLVGLALGKIGGIIGRRVGLKRGVERVEKVRYF